MEIKGKVLQVLPIESGTSRTGNQWQKAALIVETAENPKYPKKLKIANMKNAEAFAQIAVGEEVVFKAEAESREYNGRWFTEVSCWSWEILRAATQQETQPTTPQTPQETDKLPF